MSETPTPGLGNDLRQLRRSQSDRMIAGVAGGLGARLGIDPLLLRIVIAVLAIFGGVGVVLYAVGWLLIPNEDQEASVAEQALGRRDGRADSAAVALAIGLVVAILIASGSIFGSGVGPILLVLAVAGIIALLRRGGDGHDADSHEDSAEPADTMAAAPPPVAEAAAGEPSADQAYTGTGWPEGPDWHPPEPVYYAPPDPEPSRQRSYLGILTISVMVVALGVLAINEATWASYPPSVYVATALAVVGAGLLVGTWYGRSRGLIALGILLTVALPPAVVIGDNPDLVHGEELVVVRSIEQLPDEAVSFGAGELVYDLSALELSDDDEVVLEISQRFGRLEVIVPPEADVHTTAGVWLGEVTVFDGSSGGLRPERSSVDRGPDGEGGGTITLDLELGIGEIEVTR